MDPIAIPIEDVLDHAAAANPVISVWLGGHSLTSCRLVAWDRSSGILVCRGGNGFTDDDVHYLRISQVQGVTVRTPAPRADSDRLGAEIREALRAAAGYPLSLMIRPDAFTGSAAELAAWLKVVLEATTALSAMEPHREALKASVDQILLREGEAVAVLGGSTLILEATPEKIPGAGELRSAIEALL